MKSRYSTIPNVTVTSTPGDHRATCSACGFDEAYPNRPSADVMAVEHVKSHGRWVR